MLLRAIKKAATGSTPGKPTRVAVFEMACTNPCRLLTSFEGKASSMATVPTMQQKATVAPPKSNAKGIERRGFLISSPMKEAVSHPPKANVSTDQKMRSLKCTLGVIECMVNEVAEP